MAVELYINERKIQLGEESIIALDRQVNGLAELKDRQADLTNQIKIPRTAENDRILGFVTSVNSSSKIPYRRLPARVIQNGINIIPSGVATIKEVREKEISIVIYGGNANFFAEIEKKDVRDLDLPALNHTWDFETVRDNRNNTEGFIYALHDPQNGSVNTNGNEINPRGLRPQIFVHTLMDAIIDEAGFKNISPFLNTDPFYRSFVIPVDKLRENLIVTPKFIEDREFVGAKNTIGSEVEIFAGSTGAEVLLFDEDGGTPNPAQEIDPLGQWDPATGTYTAFDSQDVSFAINQSIFVRVVKLNAGSLTPGLDPVVDIAIYKNGVEEQQLINTIMFENLDGGESGTFVVDRQSSVISLEAGDVIDFRIDLFFVGAPDPFNWECYASYKNIHDPEGSGWFSSCNNIIKTGTNYGGTIFPVSNLPELNQLDLVKGIAQKFGLIFDTDARKKEINAVKFETIEANKDKAVDMTSKLDTTKPLRKKHSFGNQYAQKNWIRYTENEDEIFKEVTDGFFLIDDINLKGEDNLFELPFIGTPLKKKLITTNKSVYMATFAYEAQDKPRIFALRDVNENYALNDLVQNETGLNPWKACYFETPPEPDSGDAPSRNMTAQSFIDEDYQPFVRVLNNLKVIEEEFFVSEVDIIDVSFFIPIFVKGQGNFYLNRIKKFREGRSTTYQIVKL